MQLSVDGACGAGRETGHPFELEAFARQMLLTGQDEIALTLGYEAQIREYETRQRAAMPWLTTR